MALDMSEISFINRRRCEKIGLQLYLEKLVESNIELLIVTDAYASEPDDWVNMKAASIDEIKKDLLNHDMSNLYLRDNNYEPPVGRWVALVQCNTWSEDYVADYNFVSHDSKHKWKGYWENRENKHAMYRPDEFNQALKLLGNTDVVLEYLLNMSGV